jgi:hypothetical protein
VIVAANTIIGGVSISVNSWTPSNTTSAALVAANTIGGTLACTGNTGTPTNQGNPNTVTGTRTGQCATL